MLIAGAVCPHPPLLIPEALGSAASDPPDELRKVAAAAARAVAGLAAAGPEVIVVVGGGAAEREYGADAAGGLHAFGVGVTIGAGEPVLPLSLTVGRWLLEQGGILAGGGPPAGAAGGRRMHGRLLCMSAPYGVTYLVASWDEPRPDLCRCPDRRWHRTPVTCRGKRWLRSGHAVREGTRHRERLRDPARPR